MVLARLRPVVVRPHHGRRGARTAGFRLRLVRLSQPRDRRLEVVRDGREEALALLDACPTVHTVANMAVGYDNVDVPAATERGVLVTNTPDVLTDTSADIAFALLLAILLFMPTGILGRPEVEKV